MNRNLKQLLNSPHQYHQLKSLQCPRLKLFIGKLTSRRNDWPDKIKSLKSNCLPAGIEMPSSLISLLLTMRMRVKPKVSSAV